MKNTNKVLMIGACILLLIMGTSVTTMQSFAESGSNDENKKHEDKKSKTSADSQTDRKSASQHQDQDNVCYIGNETCTQANEGQGTIGKDNDAVGFTDQSNNFPLFTPSTPTPTPTPTAQTCDECFTTILTSDQIDNLNGVFGDDVSGTSEICSVLSNPGISETGFRTGLASAGIPEAKIIDLINCLKESGIVFLT